MAERPVLVALKGLPGSGKSTLARALARRLSWPLIDKDDVKDLIDGYAEESGRLSYAVMYRIAERQLEQGLSVLCDSPLTYAAAYQQLCAIVARQNAHLLVLLCRLSDDTLWQRRIEGRQALNLPSHHVTSWARVQAQRAGWEAETAYPIDAPLLALDGARPLAELVTEAVAWIRHETAARQADE